MILEVILASGPQAVSQGLLSDGGDEQDHNPDGRPYINPRN